MKQPNPLPPPFHRLLTLKKTKSKIRTDQNHGTGDCCGHLINRKVLRITVYTCLRNATVFAKSIGVAIAKVTAPTTEKTTDKVTIHNRLTTLVKGSFSYALLGSVLITGGFSSRVYAQQVNPQLRAEFLADPLAQEPRDPLLPALPVERDYSPLEKQTIAANLDQLNQQATQLLAAGAPNAAFALWRRELKLRRVLDTSKEFDAIARVADIAWTQQRSVDVQLLTLRTREIWYAVKTSLGIEPETEPEAQLGGPDMGVPEDSLISGATTADMATLSQLANTFTTLRDVESAVEVYEQLILLSSNDPETQAAQQLTLAELHVTWFQFAEATNLYLALRNNARASGNTTQEIEYLEQLAYTYQAAQSLPNAVRAQTDLLELYRDQRAEEKFPELMVAIAQNYRALNLHTSAIDYYRAAYSTAQKFDQFSFSAQVLKDLGELYESLALTEKALGAYTLLVPVEQQAYNDYGLMNAYDKIGQLQRHKGDNLEALKAFEKGLVLATRLGVQEDYFIEQIGSVI